MKEKHTYLIIGLGNIGSKYNGTRHNVGFEVLDLIQNKYEFPDWREQHHAYFSRGKIDGNDVILAKPTTFMNLSGTAVLALSTFYKIPVSNILVIHDDLDLKIGDMRTKRGGGHGGHNGLRDIDAKLGKEYARVRIGVGHPRDSEFKNTDPADWVLGKFNETDIQSLLPVVKKVVDDPLIYLK